VEEINDEVRARAKLRCLRGAKEVNAMAINDTH
jgi:hypothetical protein